MFSKLKQKLKETLSVFSKKTEEIIKEEVKEKIQDKDVKEEIKKEIKKEKVKKEDKKGIIEEKLPKGIKKEEKKGIKVKKKGIIKEKKVTIKTEKLTKDEFERVEETVAQIEEEKEEPKTEEKPAEKEETKPIEQIEGLVEDKPEVHKEKPKTEEKKKSFISKTKEIFTTKKISTEKFDDLFWSLELLLLEHNVAVEVIERIKEDLKYELVDKSLLFNVGKKVTETLKNTISEVLTVETFDMLERIRNKRRVSDDPYVIAFFGINGSGKTTTIAKLANLFKEKHLSCVFAAADTFRAAAIQQLEEHANKLNIRLIKHDYGADAAAVAYDAISYAKKNKIDVVLIDTAGRLHSNVNLMDELQKICRVTKPDLRVFIGESITGNDCIEQAQRFNDHIGISGIIMTKADIDEKGGTPLSISYITKKPIFYLGIGQNYNDLEEFSKEKILKKLEI